MRRMAQLLLLAMAATMAGLAPSRAADRAWPIDEVMGKKDAPITIIEYSSLTCPHCADFHEKTLPRVKADWIDTGKAKLILRDFPLDPFAQAAAMISHCSGDRYFSFIAAFFHTQAEWVRAESPLGALEEVAKVGGMEPNQVEKCLDDRPLLDEINARKIDSEQTYGVNQTPTFIINGKKFAGDMSYEQFAKLLAGRTD